MARIQRYSITAGPAHSFAKRDDAARLRLSRDFLRLHPEPSGDIPSVRGSCPQENPAALWASRRFIEPCLPSPPTCPRVCNQEISTVAEQPQPKFRIQDNPSVIETYANKFLGSSLASGGRRTDNRPRRYTEGA